MLSFYYNLSIYKKKKEDKQKEIVFKWQNCLFQLISDYGQRNTFFEGWGIRIENKLNF